MLWWQVCWPRAMMSNQLAACQDVLWYCIYRWQFKDKKSHIKNRRLNFLTASYVVKLVGACQNVGSAGRELCCRASWLRAKMSSELVASLDYESVDRELCYRDSWPRVRTCCDIVYIGNVLNINKSLIKNGQYSFKEKYSSL